MKELNVIGTMQLLAACQKAPGCRHLVVKSTTTVYGASSRDPAMFTEDMEPRRAPRAGYAKDVAEIEGYVRGFARRRPDVRVTMIRCANVIGPHVVSPLTSYFRLPVIPTVLGFDPRLQFLHEQRPPRRAAARRARRRRRHLQRRRRRHPDALPGGTPAAAADGAAAAVRGRRRRLAAALGAARGLLARAARPAHLRSRRRHHPDARRARLRAGVHHRGGVRRLRRAAHAHRWPHRAGARPRGRQPARPGPLRRRGGRSPSMGDAEIIPIGTRGRPGRGTGTQPSSAARGLAAGAKSAPAKAAPRAAPKPAPKPKPKPKPEPQPVEEVAPPVEETRPAATTRDRTPTGGIPVADWLAAFQHAAREVFGDAVGAAAGPVPGLPAPPGDRRLRRRRVRLRPRDHRALLHGRAAPDRAEVVPHRGPRASRTSRPRAARSSSPTTPARSRSTA